MAQSFKIDRVAFYGRTLAEYQHIFNFDLSLWTKYKILDCPSGASSFAAEAKKLGVHVVACDPLFINDIDTLVTIGKTDIEHVIERMTPVLHFYNWNFYSSLEVLKECRTTALEQFSKDYPAGRVENRYIKGELPDLLFGDKTFDIVLSGHFLFTYSDKFDYSFHLASVLELYRICSSEVRIYPLQGPDAKPYDYLNRLLSDLKVKSIKSEILPVPFEFQKGSNKMLRLFR